MNLDDLKERISALNVMVKTDPIRRQTYGIAMFHNPKSE